MPKIKIQNIKIKNWIPACAGMTDRGVSSVAFGVGGGIRGIREVKKIIDKWLLIISGFYPRDPSLIAPAYTKAMADTAGWQVRGRWNYKSKIPNNK